MYVSTLIASMVCGFKIYSKFVLKLVPADSSDLKVETFNVKIGFVTGSIQLNGSGCGWSGLD